MRKFLYFLMMVALISTTFSCAHVKKKDGEIAKPAEDRFKGTDAEIMTAFKSALADYEIDIFDIINLGIVTKLKKMDESNPNYEKYKRITDIYEKYEIVMKRENNEMVVDVKYTITGKELNMKTGRLEFV